MTTPVTATRSLSLVAMILVVGIAAANARLLIGSTWDDVRYHTEIAPPRLEAAAQIQRGSLPAWWDGSGLGVPLASEPSHGALYPFTWLASSQRALDWLAVAHLIWLAVGIAVWARLRSPDPPRHRTWLGEASEPAAVVVAILVATGGLAASAAMRGALPAIAHLPWIGAAAAQLTSAETKRGRTHAAVALGVLIGLVGLAGFAGSLVDALVIAIAIGARRRIASYLALAIAAGLAISAAQWLPALLELSRDDRAGGVVAAIPFARLVELVVPLAAGSSDPERAVDLIAGTAPWAPSLFVGAPLLALAAVRIPSRRVLIALAVFALGTLVVGRGGWPQAFGAPELQLAALIIVLGAHAGSGLDALAAGERRAFLSVAAGTACTGIALIALAVLRKYWPVQALDRVLIDGSFCLVAGIGLLALAWRGNKRLLPIVFALLVLPNIGSQHTTSPITDRDVIDTPPAWVELAATPPAEATTAPRRVFRPVYMTDNPTTSFPTAHAPTNSLGHRVVEPTAHTSETLDDAIATFGGTSAARWGIAAARSDDPARLAAHDRAWAAAAFGGGLLLDRYSIGLAILPESLVGARGFRLLGQRGRWALVEYPAAPAASVMRGWSRAVDPLDALPLLFPGEGVPPLARGIVVLGAAGPSENPHGPPLPCTITDWSPGDISTRCTTDLPGYAAISSTPSPGWSVTVDDGESAWVSADILRRAVAIPAGTHDVRWRYTAPGLRAGLIFAGLGLALLIASMLASRR